MEASLGSIFTVLSFIVFVGIQWWALGKRRKRAFDEAAREPFALPDDVGATRKPTTAKSNGGGASQ